MFPVNDMFQPVLRNEIVTLFPLKGNDFDALYAVACDPMIWEQHPNRNRYKKEVFEVFFQGAIESKGAFKICSSAEGNVIGSSRFYGYNAGQKTLSIGYTFFAKSCWGKGFNHSAKVLMLNHAFHYADIVHFHIGAVNIRSQKSIEMLGAAKVAEQKIAYYGEPENLNFIYAIDKDRWRELRG